MTRIVPPTDDLMFKKLFSSPEYVHIIRGFLKEVLNLKVNAADIVIKNPYSIKSYLEAQNASDPEPSSKTVLRTTIPDVTIAIIDTANVTIEMQLVRPKYLMERIHYYIDDTFISNYNQGATLSDNKYSTLKPVISLNILNFNLFADTRALRTFRYRDDQTFEELNPQLKQIGFFELSKPLSESPTISSWQGFLKTGSANQQATETIRNAAKIVQYQNLDPKERAVIDREQRLIDTTEAILAYARDEGFDDGSRQREIQIAKTALDHGISAELVASFTQLPFEEVIQLQATTTA